MPRRKPSRKTVSSRKMAPKSTNDDRPAPSFEYMRYNMKSMTLEQFKERLGELMHDTMIGPSPLSDKLILSVLEERSNAIRGLIADCE
jgi:hypothetical protein